MRALLPLLAVLAGCGSISGPVSTGPNTFMVASQGVTGNGSGAKQKAKALEVANSYCKEQGLQMVVIRTNQAEPMFGRAPSGEVEFKCAKQGS